MTVTSEFPVFVVERANVPGFEPSGDAVEVVGVVACAPGDVAFLSGGRDLVCLALDTELHDVVPADSAVINLDV